ncbi:MAG: SpoIIE family protein phosphatase [candidate division Zixibacteria bacterium]|nr:SpoIIE family protein phosphatase [candidate division Zixibacteria bacterium]
MYKLTGTDGNKFYSWDIVKGTYLIGRDEKADFSLPHKTVSRKHAKIEIDSSGEKLFLIDLGSRNGIAVNDKRIEGKIQLNLGDSIMFGQTEFKISSDKEANSSQPSFPKTTLSGDEPIKSVFLSINEALKPLPKKVSELPDLLPTLFDMAKLLVLAEPKEVMLQKSLQAISKIIPAQRLMVLFVSEDQEDVYTAASILPEGSDPGKLTLSKTIINDIIANKNAILITDPTEDPRFAEQKSIILSEMKSAMAVPLFDEGKVLGILYVDTTLPMHVYNDDYLRVMATFGNIIASKLLNYSLLSERQEKEVIKRELDKASSIQKSLLVDDPPEVEGYDVFAFQEQSRSVGGDLYDMALLNDGRFLFMVADVSGKGMGAALLMSNILASFRILYDVDCFDLKKAVEKVSIQLFNNSRPGDFATLFIGILDPVTGKVDFVNAGHNPPLLLRKNGKMEKLEPGGAMIGAFDFVKWDADSVELSDGDLIFIFSDGVTEADNGDEQYGDDRTEKYILETDKSKTKEIISELMDNIETFMGDAPHSDDITMLALKRSAN